MSKHYKKVCILFVYKVATLSEKHVNKRQVNEFSVNGKVLGILLKWNKSVNLAKKKKKNLLKVDEFKLKSESFNTLPEFLIS